MDWKGRVRAAFEGRSLPDDDVIEELAQHAAAQYEAMRAEGSTPRDAIARLERQLTTCANETSVLRRRRHRAAAPIPPPAGSPSTTWSMSFAWLADLRYAFRLLGRERSYTLLIVGTMALGIAAVTVLFSIAYGVLLKPLPWPESDRLIRLYETREGATRPATRFTNAAYLPWQEHHSTIEGLGGWAVSRRIVTIDGSRERMPVVGATPTLFDVLRVRPVLGSLFAERDGAPADEREALISRGLWQQRFGGRPDVLGRSLDIDGERYHVVGVVPDRFAFVEDEANIWIPFRIKPVLGPEGMRSLSMFGAIARLRPGLSAAQAAAEGTARGRTAPNAGPVAMAVFGSNGPVIVRTEPLLDSIAGEVRPALVVLLAAVVLLLVTATANVASLQLARALGRRREMAVRSAIGAPAPRLVRQLLIENVLLGALGGLIGLAVAAWLHRALPSLLPSQFPRLADIALDWRVAASAALVAIVTGLAFGLAPALHARRVDLVSTLNEDASAPVGVSARTRVARARAAIMAAQIAVACVLLVGAALLARSFIALAAAPRGYDPSNVLTCRVVMPDTSFTPAARDNAVRALLARLQSRPEVLRAAFTTAMPLASGDIVASFPMRSPRSGTDVQVSTTLRYVTPDYFATLGIRIVEGRVFTPRDDDGALDVVVINRAFARQYLDDTPLNDSVPARTRSGDATSARVVGIIDNVRQNGMTDPPQPELYRSMLQAKDGLTYDYPLLVVRTAGDPLKLAPEVRSLVRGLAPAALVEDIQTMESKLQENLARPRLYAVLLVVFACAALLIAAVGLFGVLAYTVTLRSREIGVRAALGASPRAIALLVLRQSAWLTSIGLVAGLGVAYVAGRSLASFLYGVSPDDVGSFAAVAAVLLIAAAVASVVPARRAASVDPLTVLK